jgi:hypothetical protein
MVRLWKVLYAAVLLNLVQFESIKMEDFMSEDDGKLVVADEPNGKWRIFWSFDGELGGLLGQQDTDGLGEAPNRHGDWAHWAACKAVKDFLFVERDGLVFIGIPRLKQLRHYALLMQR